MRGQTVLFYVSSHGFGHATRVAEVIRALLARMPDLSIWVRTSAPPEFFTEISAAIRHESVRLDAGVVEANTLLVDEAATLHQAEVVHGAREQTIAVEVAMIRRERVALVVADVPSLAGEIAAAAAVPCLGLGNFTWDWIYEPYAQSDPRRWRPVIEAIRQGYARMTAFLQLPFGQHITGCTEVIPMPLVARRSTRDPGDVLRALRLDPEDSRPRVLVGMRAQVSRQSLAEAAAAGEFVFLHLLSERIDLPTNTRRVTQGVGIPDVLSICDVVISKLGYGILSECVSAQKPLLYPPRSGFREDEILRVEGPRYTRMRAISREDFEVGNWDGDLRRLLSSPTPSEVLATDGSRVCAELIAAWLAR